MGVHIITTCFNRVATHIAAAVRRCGENLSDILTGLRQPGALPPRQRRLDGFKLGAGGLTMVAGAAELNPAVVAGGAIPVWEAARELRDNGHRWRSTHNSPPSA